MPTIDSKTDIIIGVIYPLPKRTIEKISNRKEAVFVKFTTHYHSKKTKPKLEEGMKFYLYQSGGDKEIVADATILNQEYLYFKEVLDNYDDLLLISKNELKEYSKGREDKRLLVLKLKNLKFYNKPIRLKKPITMAGQYVTKNNKYLLFSE